MHTPGLPVSLPYVAAMKAAACSWRVSTSSIDDVRMDSTTSRFSSPGMPKMRSTPSFSRAATSRSEPRSWIRSFRRNSDGELGAVSRMKPVPL